MARDLPYFKFYCSEWMNGLITLESLSAQGLFINTCAYYWFKSGKLSLTEIKRRLSKGKEADWETLINSGMIKVKADNISISFLDEQLHEREHVSEINSQNGKKGGRPKATGLISVIEKKANESNIEQKRTEQRENENYSHAKEAFEDITKNYLETEPQRNILKNKGWTSATEQDINALLFHFLELQVDISLKTKKDVKSHFRNWLNKKDAAQLQTLAKQIHGRQTAKVH